MGWKRPALGHGELTVARLSASLEPPLCVEPGGSTAFPRTAGIGAQAPSDKQQDRVRRSPVRA